METTPITPSTQKVRRDAVGGKRGDGDRRTRRIQRADARNITVGRSDPTLTAYAGLAPFGAWMRREGIDDDLHRLFFRLKPGRLVIYPMAAQLRLLIDANFAGEERVFGLEGLAADRLFVHLAGGVVPSLDTVYRDLERFVAGHTDPEESGATPGRRARAVPKPRLTLRSWASWSFRS
jgi:hypothetical protein